MSLGINHTHAHRGRGALLSKLRRTLRRLLLGALQLLHLVLAIRRGDLLPLLDLGHLLLVDALLAQLAAVA